MAFAINPSVWPVMITPWSDDNKPDFLTAAAMIEMRFYPVNTKYHQQLVDVPMNIFSRSADCAKLDKNAKGAVESLIALENYVHKQLGI